MSVYENFDFDQSGTFEGESSFFGLKNSASSSAYPTTFHAVLDEDDDDYGQTNEAAVEYIVSSGPRDNFMNYVDNPLLGVIESPLEESTPTPTPTPPPPPDLEGG